MKQTLVTYTPGSTPRLQNEALSRFLSTFGREVATVTNDKTNSCWVVKHK